MSKELDRHTIDVQDEIINELRGEVGILVDHVLELRRLLRECQPYVNGLDHEEAPDDLRDRVKKEVGNE